MTLWHYGQPLVFDKKIDQWFLSELIRPKMDYLLMVFISEKKLYYSLRYWKGPQTPWTTPQLVSNTAYQGQIQSLVSIRPASKNYLQIAVQLTDNRIDMIWINPDDLAEIKEIEGEKEVFYCGNSARQILRSHVKLDDPINGLNYLYEYEDRIINSDCNFVREDIIDVEKWGQIVAEHTENFISHGITVQYTLSDGEAEGYGNWRNAIEFLKPYGDRVILEAVNEFLDDEDEVNRAVTICKTIDEAGLISSGGAWGNSTKGEMLSKRFLDRYQPQIITMHRPYPPIWEYEKWIKYLKGFGKPIIQNEFLTNGLNLAQIEVYCRIGFGLNLKGFNIYGGDGGTEYLGVMGRLCKEFN